MKKSLIFTIFAILVMPVMAADSGSTSGPKYSIFSTSTDWQGLTGLQYSEYRGKFVRDSALIGRQGLVLYYLDGFPCYGLGFGVRIWLGPKNQHDGSLDIACVYPPTEIKFTWRNATRDADQATATGLMTCPVTTSDREITIDLSKCTTETGWSKYQ